MDFKIKTKNISGTEENYKTHAFFYQSLQKNGDLPVELDKLRDGKNWLIYVPKEKLSLLEQVLCSLQIDYEVLAFKLHIRNLDYRIQEQVLEKRLNSHFVGVSNVSCMPTNGNQPGFALHKGSASFEIDVREFVTNVANCDLLNGVSNGNSLVFSFPYYRRKAYIRIWRDMPSFSNTNTHGIENKAYQNLQNNRSVQIINPKRKNTQNLSYAHIASSKKNQKKQKASGTKMFDEDPIPSNKINAEIEPNNLNLKFEKTVDLFTKALENQNNLLNSLRETQKQSLLVLSHLQQNQKILFSHFNLHYSPLVDLNTNPLDTSFQNTISKPIFSTSGILLAASEDITPGNISSSCDLLVEDSDGSIGKNDDNLLQEILMAARSTELPESCDSEMDVERELSDVIFDGKEHLLSPSNPNLKNLQNNVNPNQSQSNKRSSTEPLDKENLVTKKTKMNH